MSYENAASTKMLATSCAICSRPLRDAVSVECGMGPECREKYFVPEANVLVEARDEANKLIHFIALEQTGIRAMGAVRRLRELGFAALASKLATRLVGIVITEENNVLTVLAPYTERAVNAFRQVPGRSWNGASGTNTFPSSSRMALVVALEKAFRGEPALGPKGFFTVGDRPSKQNAAK